MVISGQCALLILSLLVVGLISSALIHSVSGLTSSNPFAPEQKHNAKPEVNAKDKIKSDIKKHPKHPTDIPFP